MSFAHSLSIRATASACMSAGIVPSYSTVFDQQQVKQRSEQKKGIVPRSFRYHRVLQRNEILWLVSDECQHSPSLFGTHALVAVSGCSRAACVEQEATHTNVEQVPSRVQARKQASFTLLYFQLHLSRDKGRQRRRTSLICYAGSLSHGAHLVPYLKLTLRFRRRTAPVPHYLTNKMGKVVPR